MARAPSPPGPKQRTRSAPSGSSARRAPALTRSNPVDQNGDYARQLKANLEGITLPPGFSIDLFAVVPDARHIAVGQQGVAIFVGTRKQDVWVATDRDKDRRADEVKRFAPSVQFNVPNRPCFSRDGVLYVAE